MNFLCKIKVSLRFLSSRFRTGDSVEATKDLSILSLTISDMTAETPNSEQSSHEGKSQPTSPEVKETASKSVFEDAGKLDPEFLDLDTVEEGKKSGETQKEPDKKDDPEKKGNAPEKKPDEDEDKPLSDEEKKQLLRGEEPQKKDETPKKGEVEKTDLENAGDKLYEQFDKAVESNDTETLEKVEAYQDAKPKLFGEVVSNLFENYEEKISNGDADALQKIADLSKTNPKVADSLAQKFFVKGEDDKPVHLENLEELFSLLGFSPKKVSVETKKVDLKEDEALFEIDKKSFSIAREMNMTFEEFEKTPIYKAILKKSSAYIQKGVEVDVFWDDVKTSVMKDVDLSKEKQKYKNASEISGGGGSDFSGGGGDISNADSSFLDGIGKNTKSVRDKIAKRKTK